MIPDLPPPLVWPHAWRPEPPVILVSPECRDGNKHHACYGYGWNETTDQHAPCPCTCHTPETETP